MTSRAPSFANITTGVGHVLATSRSPESVFSSGERARPLGLVIARVTIVTVPSGATSEIDTESMPLPPGVVDIETSLGESRPEYRIEVNRELAPYVDVMIGNEEDFTASLGFEVKGADHSLSAIETDAFKAMIETADKPLAFDAQKFKHMTRAQWDAAAQAWHHWAPLLARWLEEAR